jgi:hypothetical protein
MNGHDRTIYLGDTPQQRATSQVTGQYVDLLGEQYYQIQHYDAMEPFFMSIVSSSNHWLYIASTGGITAGRVSPEQSLFPYYTVDKITENNENSGSKTILLVRRDQRKSLWEPFSERDRGNYRLECNLYKNISSTAVVFEEKNIDLGLTCRYAWRVSEKFGFVKTTWLINTGDTACQVEFVDGLQNILPANVTSQTQNTMSCLLDAYKRSELDAETGLAIFALSSTLTDLAEPSESLLATTVAQLGLDHPEVLLSSVQLEPFRRGYGVTMETDVRGQRGAYFVHASVELAPGAERSWHLLADVSQDHAAIIQKIEDLKEEQDSLFQDLEEDIATGHAVLEKILAGADGIQHSNDLSSTAHHYANVMFNVMRGGTLADQYWIQKTEFVEYVSVHDRRVLQAHTDFFTTLPDRLHISDLRARAETNGANDLVRLSFSYMPLIFSRRHGDPSRPWNRFNINLKKSDGSLKLGYEGNWRDIFQNWEALAYSYPEFVENMLGTFLNATTADGYNPYRITYHGVDWEVLEPDNPWANIGYWSDHQIIYLQKLMGVSQGVHPGLLEDILNKPMFSYARVPYRIKPYADLLKDPYNTIEFDWDLEGQIEARQMERGTDAKLVTRPDGEVLQVTLVEKMLTLLLAKLANFVPEGGIWMNTQRPEWNDANNALVGKGLSVVTLSYLRRMIAFTRELFRGSEAGAFVVNDEVAAFFTEVSEILRRFQPLLHGSFSDEQRHVIMDALGQSGSAYRWNFYQHGFSGKPTQLSAGVILAFLDLAQRYIEHSLRANRRSDHLYHAYNILHLGNQRASITHLYEMLEGQVAILSSGMLSGEESIALLDSLRHSALYVADQHSYILYPDRELPSFLEKNCLAPEQVRYIQLFPALAEAHDRSLIIQDLHGDYHFSGTIRNLRDVNRALMALEQDPTFTTLVEAEADDIRDLFEETFHHNEFTGRSGTFFAYEGLGSIYWHMVSKLLLAVQETAVRFRHEPTGKALIAAYRDVRNGLGFKKSPASFGAFPTDPYSHTPKGQGAKQPGMTGAVKEEILTRQAELGLIVQDGRLTFDLCLVDRDELLPNPGSFTWIDLTGRRQSLDLPSGSLGYTICQAPVVLRLASEDCITIFFSDGKQQTMIGHILDVDNSRHIFRRDGLVHHLEVCCSRTG